jgi:outer membrane protein OmpA-like peptidoglycan-associated protein
MAFNVIEEASSAITPNVVKKLAEYFGENSANTQAALNAIVPSIVGAAAKEASSPAGSMRLMELISPDRLNTDFLNDFSGFFGSSDATQKLLSKGSALVTTLLGSNATSVARVVADAAKVRDSSASSLLGLVSPVVLGLLGREVARRGVPATNLFSLLSSNMEAVQKLAPAGLAAAVGVGSVAGLFSSGPATLVGAYDQGSVIAELAKVGAYEQTKEPVVGTYQEAAAAPAVGAYEQTGTSKWWLWAIPLLAILGLAWYFLGVSRTPQGILASIALPCGTTLQVMEGSFNYTLANFMMRGSDSEMPKRIVFDHLNFDSATTNLTPESDATVTNMAAIMKCYPKMQVRLEGHTDNTGDAEANRKLSMDRAESVKALLVQDGVDGSRILTAGFGQERPIASNDTEEGKAKNRRTELEITAR